MDKHEFRERFLECVENIDNPFHPLVWINGQPQFGHNVAIGGFSEVNASGAEVLIGDNCDIASFVAINVADSHKYVLGLTDDVERKSINIENNVFIGSHCLIKGGARIGHHTVIAAGTIVNGVSIPPYSLVFGNPMQVKPGYYSSRALSDVQGRSEI